MNYSIVHQMPNQGNFFFSIEHYWLNEQWTDHRMKRAQCIWNLNQNEFLNIWNAFMWPIGLIYLTKIEVVFASFLPLSISKSILNFLFSSSVECNFFIIYAIYIVHWLGRYFVFENHSFKFSVYLDEENEMIRFPYKSTHFVMMYKQHINGYWIC